MSGLTYLITGAARGIGKGLCGALLLRDNTTVIVAVRNTTTAQESLSTLPVGSGSKLIIVKIDSTSDTDPAAAASELKTKYSINRIDILISNAGVFEAAGTLLETSAEQARAHLETNTLGPLFLLQAFMPLLAASTSPKFFVVSSTLGSISEIKNYTAPFGAYGISKAAVNYVVRKLAFENPAVVCMSLCPGWVQTEMGNRGAQLAGLPQAPLTLGESIEGLLKVVDGATLEKTGTFTNYAGEEVAW